MSILDFLYFGEANVFQEDLDSFLVIAEEIQLKGLTNQSSKDLIQEQEEPQYAEPIQEDRNLPKKLATPYPDLKHKRNVPITAPTTAAVAILNQSSIDLQALDEKVKSMMEKGQKMIPTDKRQQTSYICKVCGKEGLCTLIRDHIEANHLKGICIPCDFCDKTFSSRNTLNNHKSRLHR